MEMPGQGGAGGGEGEGGALTMSAPSALSLDFLASCSSSAAAEVLLRQDQSRGGGGGGLSAPTEARGGGGGARCVKYFGNMVAQWRRGQHSRYTRRWLQVTSSVSAATFGLWTVLLMF